MIMKKIVIIGANSYIARNLLYVLKKKKPNCHVDLYDYAETHMDGAENYHCIHILEMESVAKIDLNCDIIFMFVGKTGSINGFDSYDDFIDINQRALLNLLAAYRKQNSKAKIVFPSTRLVYKGKKGSQKEDAEKEYKTIYAINKFACEQYLEQYHNIFDTQYCIFRICIPYGTLIPHASSYGTAEFMLNSAMERKNISLYGDGSVRRTLTYMGDLCNAIIDGAFCRNCINDVYNIGGEDYSLKEMAELIAEKYNVGIDYVQYPDIALKIESGDTVFDDSKLQKVCPVNYKMKFAEWCKL
jgi:UDP-glucose 4-epimerase